MKTLILFLAILSAIGTYTTKDDQPSIDDQSHYLLAIVTSVFWAIYITQF